MPMFGAHMSVAGGYFHAVESAHKYGFDTVQLFTKSNNQWKAKPLTELDIQLFRAAVVRTGVRCPVAHNSYLINLASPDDFLWTRSIEAMVVECERAESLGIQNLVAHPGAHMGTGEEVGLSRIAAGLDEVHRRTQGLEMIINLESTAGQGTCLGHRLEHLGEIFKRVAAPERLGVCLDTCHLFAAGYPLSIRDEYDQLISDLAKSIGIDRVRVWHLNDSLKSCGSRVDRHAGLGRGAIGLKPFEWIVNDHRFSHIPMILETPKGIDGDEELDAINLRILKQLNLPAPEKTTAKVRKA